MDEVREETHKDKGTTEQRVASLLTTMQELIGVYRDAFGEDCKFEIRSRTLRKIRIFELRFLGDELNPQIDRRAYNLRHLLKYSRDIPLWSYRHGWNVILIIVPRISSTSGVLRFCLDHAKGSKAYLVPGFAVQLVGVFFNIAASFLVAQLIVQYTDSAIMQATLSALLIFACVMLEELTICISEWVYNKVTRHILVNIQEELVDNVLNIQTASMNTHGNSVFVRCMTDDAEVLASGLSNFSDMVIQVASYIGTLVAVFVVSWQLFIFESAMLILPVLQLTRGQVTCHTSDISYRRAV